MRPQRRFEFWRSLHPAITIDTVDKADRGDFAGDRLHCSAPDGCTFGYTLSDSIVTRFGTGAGDFVLLSTVLAGAVQLEPQRGPSRDIGPGDGLLVVDGTRPLTMKTRNLAHLYLRLPAAMAEPLLSRQDWSVREGSLTLPATGLTRFLISHMEMMAREGETLDAYSTAVAMKTAADLAMGILERAGHTGEIDYNGPQEGKLAEAALRYIKLNIEYPDLCAESVAYAMGCSRAHLYRAFAEQGQSVGMVIRSARMQRAMTLLQTSPPMALKRIALLCGYGSSSSFTRAFGEHTGLTPARFRAKHLG